MITPTSPQVRDKTGARKQAAAMEETTYYTGIPCVHGHIARRWTCDGTCTECTAIGRQTGAYRDAQRVYSARTRARYPDKIKADKVASYDRVKNEPQHKAKNLAKSQVYYWANKQKVLHNRSFNYYRTKFPDYPDDLVAAVAALGRLTYNTSPKGLKNDNRKNE